MAIFYDWGDSGAKKAETNIYLDLKTNKKIEQKKLKWPFRYQQLRQFFLYIYNSNQVT